MCQKQSTKSVTVEEVFRACDFRACDADSMEEVAKQAPLEFCVIPVFDYSHKYVGALQAIDFVRFQNEYFENLDFDDRGNEFVIAPEEPGIQFVPINRVSRYIDKSIQPVGLGESIEQTESMLVEQGISAAPVFDKNNHIVGTISLLDIAKFKSVHGSQQRCCRSESSTKLGSG